MKIALVALDDHAARRIEGAATAGLRTTRISRLSEAEHAIATQAVRAIVIGGDHSSPELLRRLSRKYATAALIVWGAGISSELTATLLLAGASDVLRSGMSDAELRARIVRAIGTSAAQRMESSSIGDLAVDAFRGETTWRGERVPLTNRERDVLDVLVQEQGRTLRREVIYERVWGHAMPAGDRNVDVNVKRLRHKLASATNGRATIETISRVGYRLQVVKDDSEGDNT